MCTVAPKWSTELGMALVNVMVGNAYWTASRLPCG
jgi:hypothetical protein